MKGKYLITTDNWFLAPDGKQYKAIWGDVEIIEDYFLGVKTNRNSSNWFAKISGNTLHVIIAGCQIHYAIQCNNKPHDDFTEDWSSDYKDILLANKVPGIYIRPSMIYIPD